MDPSFCERMKAFAKANTGFLFVIHSKPEPNDAAKERKARDAWFDYLNANGLHRTLACWRAILNGGGKAITVPTERPELFDLAYVPPKRPGVWDEEPPPKCERSQAVAERAMETLAGLRMHSGRGKLDSSPKPPPPSFADWEAEFRSRPIPVLSDEVRKEKAA